MSISIHELRDVFETIHSMARGGKKGCDAFVALDASGAVEHDTLATVHSEIESHLRLIAEFANNALGQTTIRID